MVMDFHSGVMQGPFWSHTSYCILTRERAWELWVSLIYKSTHLIEEAPSLQLHHLTKTAPRVTITMGLRISSYEISRGHKAWDHSRYKGELAHPPAVAVVTHTPLHPHFLHHLAAIPYILSLWVSQVHVSQVSAPSHIQPIQCLLLPCWGPGNLPGSADVSISATFLLSPSLDFHFLDHVGAGEMVTRRESSDIIDLHGSVLAFSWSRWTELKFLLTNKYFPCGVSMWFSRTFTSWGSPTS